MVLSPSELYAAEKASVDRAERESVRSANSAQAASLAARSINESLASKVFDMEKRLEMRRRENPAELRAALNGLFAKYDFSPAEELVRMLKDPTYEYHVKDLNLRKQILCDLQQYVMPKLKSTEITGEIDHSHTIVIRRFGEDGKVTDSLLPAPVAPVIDVGAMPRLTDVGMTATGKELDHG